MVRNQAERRSSLRRSPAERGAAWLLTGPPGHLWSVAVDIVLLWARYGLARARGRSFTGG